MTREELYRLAWSVPAIEVARRCNVSNAQLRKICADFNIPIPPPGHWSKVAHGKPTRQPPLPSRAPQFVSKINSVLRRIGEIPLRIADSQIDDYDLQFEAPLVSDTGRIGALTERLKTALTEAPKDSDGYIEISGTDLPYVNVHAASLGRVVSIFDLLANAITARKYRLEKSGFGLVSIVDDEIFALKFYTLRSKAQFVASKSATSNPLVLELSDPRDFCWISRNLVGHWRDRPDVSLEASLEDIVAKLISASRVVKRCREAVNQYSASEEQKLVEDRALEDRRQVAIRRRDFVVELSDNYERYKKLVALAEFLDQETSELAAAGRSELRETLQSLIDEWRARLGFDRLESEFSQLRKMQ